MEIEDFLYTVDVFVKRYPKFPHAKEFYNALIEEYPYILNEHDVYADNITKAKRIFIQHTGVYPEFTDFMEYLGKRTFESGNISYWFRMYLKLINQDETFTIYMRAHTSETTMNKTGFSARCYIFDGEGNPITDNENSDKYQDYVKIFNFFLRRGIHISVFESTLPEFEAWNQLRDTLDVETETVVLER